MSTIKPEDPESGWRVEVPARKDTIVIEEEGTRRPLLTARQVDYIAWFPDGRHLLYSEYVPGMSELGPDSPQAMQNASWNLWVVHVDSGNRYSLTADGEQQRAFSIAPDGRTIALQSGVAERQGNLVNWHQAWEEDEG